MKIRERFHALMNFKKFDRLLPASRKGGFLISCDHQTPPGVSLEQYRQYLELFKEYSAKSAN